jgi:hypothetical protein
VDSGALVDVEVVGGAVVGATVVGATVVGGGTEGRDVVGVVVFAGEVAGVDVHVGIVGTVEEGADGSDVVVVEAGTPACPGAPTAGLGTGAGAAEAGVASVGQTTAPPVAVTRKASSPGRSFFFPCPRRNGVEA